MPRSNSVSGGRYLSRSDTLPNSVAFPVRTTSTSAEPLMTCVPMNSELVRFASDVSAGRSAGIFSAGYDSPVNGASSTYSSLDETTLQSPGTPSPAFRMTMSPGTMSSKGTSFSLPSRRTVAFSSTSARRSSTAPDASYSCQKPSTPLKSTMTMMMVESTGSPRKKESTAANSKIRMIGLVNCFMNSVAALT
jgi:hypothetical protein